jgi:hypothetical protein
MKFKLGYTSSPAKKDDVASSTSTTASIGGGEQSRSANAGVQGKPSRIETNVSGGGTATVNEEQQQQTFADGRSSGGGNSRKPHRLSLEVLPSPKNGRPLSLPKLDVDTGTPELAFQVPETPPRGSTLGKSFHPSFSLGNSSAAIAASPASRQQLLKSKLPFPDFQQDEESRHVICQDSIAPWTYLLGVS